MRKRRTTEEMSCYLTALTPHVPQGRPPASTRGNGRFLVHEDDDLGPIGFLLFYVQVIKDWASIQSGSCLRICLRVGYMWGHGLCTERVQEEG